MTLALLISLAVYMLSRKREQNLLMARKLRGVLAPMRSKRKIITPPTTIRKSKNSKKRQQTHLRRRTIRKRRHAIFVASLVIRLVSTRNTNWSRTKRFANMVISKTERGATGFGNSLPTILSICYSPHWCVDIDANIHICVEISLFSSYQTIRVPPCWCSWC